MDVADDFKITTQIHSRTVQRFPFLHTEATLIVNDMTNHFFSIKTSSYAMDNIPFKNFSFRSYRSAR